MHGKGNTTERGYGNDHQKARRIALAQLRDGDPCSRCHRPMYRNQTLHLDHTDDRRGYRGLAHARCNLAAGAALGNRMRGLRRHPRRAALPSW